MPHPELDAFFRSRIVFYPGFGSDGHPVKFFNSQHLADCFVYADCWVNEEQVRADLDNPRTEYNGHFLGYHSVERIPLTQSDLTPNGWRPHVQSPNEDWARPQIKPYAFLEIMERDPGFDDAHGAQRLSILFLGADGHATYDALFCQGGEQRAPYAVVLQDHGFGGNYSRFGGGGLMEEVALKSGVLPEYLFVADNTQAWSGYTPVLERRGSRGGRHSYMRQLYRHFNNTQPG